MGTKRKKHTGSVYQRTSDGRWVASVTVDGKRKSYYRQSEEEAWEVLLEFNRQQRLRETFDRARKTSQIDFFA